MAPFFYYVNDGNISCNYLQASCNYLITKYDIVCHPLVEDWKLYIPIAMEWFPMTKELSLGWHLMGQVTYVCNARL